MSMYSSDVLWGSIGVAWIAMAEDGAGTGGLTAARLDALLELRVLWIDCSSYIRWTRERPRGVRLAAAPVLEDDG